MKAVKGKVWLTETGGIVQFVLPDGRTLFKKSESRANSATKRMFKLAKEHRSRHQAPLHLPVAGARIL